MNEGSPTAEMLRASALDLVVDLGATIAMWAADRLVQIDLMRQEYLADAEAAGRRLTDVVLRGLRLELAAAMRVSEHDAGTMITRAEALVHRYPAPPGGPDSAIGQVWFKSDPAERKHPRKATAMASLGRASMVKF